MAVVGKEEDAEGDGL